MNLELEELLRAISDTTPCGIDCSFSTEFHAIQKARTQDDLLLEQGEWIAEPKLADWSFVKEKSIELLTEKTKDIRLYTWLVEAWSHLYGFNGVAKGLELTQRSLKNFWVFLHPKIEEDDLDQRLGLLQGLINQLPMLIRNIPLVNISPFYSLIDYDGLLHQQNLQRMQSEENSDVDPAATLEQFKQILLTTPKSFQDQSYQAFLEILNQWNILKEVLDGLMGLDAPSFAAIDIQLESIHGSLKKLYKTDDLDSVLMTGPSTAVTGMIASPDTVHSAIDPAIAITSAQKFQPHAQSHLANREQAMQLLQEISDYFQMNEPHSPVSYLLQKTIKWSQMPLHEWLSQVIKNDNPLETVHELLGVQKQSS